MIGQFVTSKAGHDKDTLYLIVDEEGDFVSLCDGRLKLLAGPKRKRRKHVQPMNKMADDELVEALRRGDAGDEQIKAAVRQCLRERNA